MKSTMNGLSHGWGGCRWKCCTAVSRSAYVFGLRNIRPRSPSSDSGSGRRTGESMTTAPASLSP